MLTRPQTELGAAMQEDWELGGRGMVKQVQQEAMAAATAATSDGRAQPIHLGRSIHARRQDPRLLLKPPCLPVARRPGRALRRLQLLLLVSRQSSSRPALFSYTGKLVPSSSTCILCTVSVLPYEAGRPSVGSCSLTACASPCLTLPQPSTTLASGASGIKDRKRPRRPHRGYLC